MADTAYLILVVWLVVLGVALILGVIFLITERGD